MTATPGSLSATEAEIDYLCSAAGEYFRQTIAPSDVVWTYAGVRPLYDDGASEAQAATRDYVLKVEGGGERRRRSSTSTAARSPPTAGWPRRRSRSLRHTSRQLGKPWTAAAPLPGGDFPVDGVSALEVDELQALCPSCPRRAHARLVRAYGTRARKIVEGVAERSRLGRDASAPT